MEFGRFFRYKRIMITGHTGFIGSWLASWLLSYGAKVFGFALAPETKPALFEALKLERKIEHTIGDIRDYEHILECAKTWMPEITFHLAAQPLVRRSYAESKLTCDTNIGGTVNLLEALKVVDCARLIIVMTSDKVYENQEWPWGYRENDRLGGFDPYSASKACTELIARSYYRSFFRKYGTTCIATVRAGNVIGGGDWAEDRIIPDCIRALVDNRPIEIRAPFSVRPWQHVLEPLYGCLKLALKMWEEGDAFSGEWNLGPDVRNACTVQGIVEQAIGVWGRGEWKEVPGPSHIQETNVLRLNSDKAKTLLFWTPLYDYRLAVEKTIAWYRRYYENSDVIQEFTNFQIKEYEKAQSEGG